MAPTVVRRTAVLDANVLVPYTLTDVLLRLAEAEPYRPLSDGLPITFGSTVGL